MRDCIFYGICLLLFLAGCKSAVKKQTDKVYSRHLQKHVELTIISTRMPDEKSDMNLLLFNNDADLEKIGAKKIIDSLYSKELIQPLILVGIHGNEQSYYGMSGLVDLVPGQGSKAGKYNSFVMDELYPFIKKKAVIRKFRSIAIFGNSLAGMSAFDIAWQNADKIDKVGIFSGVFNYAAVPVDYGPGNIVLNEIRSSRKRPKLQYYFYAADNNDTTTLNNTKELIDIIHKKNISSDADIQFVQDKNGNNNINSWRHQFAEFLLWAFGK
ncbi:MAG: alpha/beta hydrolase-fold protein [Ferruginibacter sp.]